MDGPRDYFLWTCHILYGSLGWKILRFCSVKQHKWAFYCWTIQLLAFPYKKKLSLLYYWRIVRQRPKLRARTTTKQSAIIEINKYWDTRITAKPHIRHVSVVTTAWQGQWQSGLGPSEHQFVNICRLIIYIIWQGKSFLLLLSFCLFLCICLNFPWFQKEHKLKPTILTAKWSNQ